MVREQCLEIEFQQKVGNEGRKPDLNKKSDWSFQVEVESSILKTNGPIGPL